MEDQVNQQLRALTKKQKGFIEDYIATGNGTQAAVNHYDVNGDRNQAKVIASNNLKKPAVMKAIAERLPDDLLEEKHLALLNKMETQQIREADGSYNFIETKHIDAQAVAKGLDMAYKIKGTYAPEKRETKTVNINITPQVLEVAKKYEEELNKLEDGK